MSSKPRLGNFGPWGGRHPPACTCYDCNEQRQREEASKEEARRVGEYDRLVAGSRARGGKQQNNPKSPVSKPWHPGKASASTQSQRTQLNPSSQQRPTSSQRRAAETVRRSKVGTQSATQSRPTTPSRKPQGRQGRILGVSKAIVASALRYALALHVVAVAGLAVYALAQGGAPSVLPTLSDAAVAYAQAWHEAGVMAGVG